MNSREPQAARVTGVRVATLGRLAIERGGESLGDLTAQPVRCALFVYLALERSATRDELKALLWPDVAEARARHSLNQTLYALRRRFGAEWVETHGDRLDVASWISVDALDFAAAVEAERDDDALAAYTGAFLDGAHFGGAGDFEHWIDRRRAHFARLFRTLCRRLSLARAARGDVAGARLVAQRWVDADPLDDEAHHRLIELLAGEGRRADAILLYEAYERRIAGELGVEPLDETKQLVARIRDGIGPVLEPTASPPLRAVAPVDDSALISPPLRLVVPGDDATPASPRKRRRLALLALLVLVLLPVLALLRSGRREAPADSTVADPARVVGPALAVLPFANLSADPEQEYFADGITEDLLTSLSRIEGLRVISRTSAWRYKGSELLVAQIAGELGVAYILEGSVRRDGSRVRITAQLIDAATDAHLWAETYERELTGIFDIQSDIAQRISDALAQQLAVGARRRIADGGTSDITAYDLLLRGREYLNRPGEGDVRKFAPAMSYFRQALTLDPGYARALAALSDAYRTHVGLPMLVRRDSALYYARRAVEADAQLAEAAASLGWAHIIARQWEWAEAALERALGLDANQVEAVAGRARLEWVRGRIDEAVRWQRLATRLDPVSARQLATLGSFLLDIGDLDGAEAAFRRSVELAPDAPASSFILAQIQLIRGDPDAADSAIDALAAAAAGHPGAQFLIGRYHAQRGRYAEAEAELARSAERLDGVTATVAVQRAHVARRLGLERRAQALLERAEADLAAREREGFYAPRLRIQLAAVRGDADLAIALLREHWSREVGGDLLAGPQIGLYWIDRDPLLEELRADPRFTALLQQIRVRLDAMRAGLDVAGAGPDVEGAGADVVVAGSDTVAASPDVVGAAPRARARTSWSPARTPSPRARTSAAPA